MGKRTEQQEVDVTLLLIADFEADSSRQSGKALRIEKQARVNSQGSRLSFIFQEQARRGTRARSGGRRAV